MNHPKTLFDKVWEAHGIDGRKMSKSYENTIDIFENENILKYDNLMENVYQSNRANYYLATFFPFIIKNKGHVFFDNMLKDY